MAEPPSDRPAGRRETREALIQAGMVELARHGLEAPSLDAICARAGFTRGAFYVHFEDREDFIAVVMERMLGDFAEAIIAPAGFPAPGAGRAIQLHRVLDACARSPRIRARWAALAREAIERASKAVLEAQVAGGVRSDLEAEQVGTLLLGLALGAVAAHESGVPFDSARSRDALLALLSAPPGAASRRRG
jgi:AcrR family transcriptional regulator